MLVRDTLFIGGEWVKPAGSETIEVINPATEEPIGRVPNATQRDVDSAVKAASDALERGPWASMEPVERAEVLSAVANAIRAEMPALADLITSEVGSPIGWGTLAQVLAPSMILDYYAGLAGSYPFEELRDGTMGKLLVSKEPVGVVAAITPWNVPLFIAAAKLAPALLAGCSVVLKPSPEAALDANRLAELFNEAGLPKGVLSVLPGGRETGEHLVGHPGVDKVSFTGSAAAGKRIGAACGAQLKRCTLELGGKSAAIILDDADLDEALPMLLPNALMNNGEACIAQTRILAPIGRYDEVVEALVEKVGQMKVGDPLDPSTEIGPLVSAGQRDRVEGFIKIGNDEGAKIVLGGDRPSGIDRGFYVEPTIFAGVENAMTIAQEEIFGPVLAVIPYVGDDEAVSIANDSRYGLCGSVWTGDPERGIEVVRRVRTGTCMLNNPIPADFAAPFGGFKDSGVGREFGPEGLEQFLELRSASLPEGFTPSLGHQRTTAKSSAGESSSE
jgi:betaine-aldehyde dehydrogenase